MTVAIQNPSSVEMKLAEIAVPHDNFNVELFDNTSMLFKPTTASVFCNADSTASGQSVDNCILYTPVSVLPSRIGLIRLTYNSSASLKGEKKAKYPMIIENEKFKVILYGYDNVGEIALTFIDKETGTQGDMYAALKWYPSDTRMFGDYNSKDTSGHYIFRPMVNETRPQYYSKFISAQLDKSDVHERITLFFGKPGKSDPKTIQEQVIVYMSLVPGLPVIKYDLDMNSLPDSSVDGYEVAVQFYYQNMKNTGNTFYTDANGLEMQKRVKNFRPTWNFANNLKASNENVTGNFYPITSAI